MEKAVKEKKKKEPAVRSELAERFLTARTEKLELDVAKKRGDLIEVEKVKLMLFEIASSTRERMESIPQALARKLSTMKEPAEIEALLRREITAALQELSREGTRSVPDDDDEDDRPRTKKKAARDSDDDEDEAQDEDETGDDDEEFNPWGGD